MLDKIKSLLINRIDVFDELERKHQIRLLSTLILRMVPIVAIITAGRIINDLDSGYYYAFQNIIVTAIAMVVMGVAFFLNKQGYYRIAVWGIIILSGIMLLVAITYTRPPHLELVYFSFLFMAAKPLLSRFELFITLLLSIAFLALAALTINDVNIHSIIYIAIFLVALYVVLHIISDYRVNLANERKAIVEASEMRLQMVLNAVPILVWTVNQESQVTAAHGDTNVIHAFDQYQREIWQQHVADRLSEQSQLTFEHEWEGHHYHNVVTAHQTDDHQTNFWVGLSIDITERRQNELNERLRIREKERNNAISTFLINASHDLRTPLSTLNTSVYLLRHTKPEDNAHLITRLGTTLEQLNKTLDNMFYIVQLQTQASTSHSFALYSVLIGIIDRYRSASQDLNKPFQAEIRCLSEFTLKGNPELLVRAIANILDNSFQNTVTDEQIEITAHCTDGEATIVVRDQGYGIAAKDLPHLFEHFFRTQTHRPLDQNNTGLGLTITKHIIDLFGGKISIESEEGVGTTVTITLPHSADKVDV